MEFNEMLFDILKEHGIKILDKPGGVLINNNGKYEEVTAEQIISNMFEDSDVVICT